MSKVSSPNWLKVIASKSNSIQLKYLLKRKQQNAESNTDLQMDSTVKIIASNAIDAKQHRCIKQYR